MIPHLVRRVDPSPRIVEVYDNFTRPNSSSLGETSVGGLDWEPLRGTWQIQSNRPYTSTNRGTSPLAVVETRLSDVEVSASVGLGGGDAVYGRVEDANNWWRARVERYSQEEDNYRTEYQWRKNYGHGDHSSGNTGFRNDPEYYVYRQWGTSSTIPPTFPDHITLSHRHDFNLDGVYTHTHTHWYDAGWKDPVYTGETREYYVGKLTQYYSRIHLERCQGGSVTYSLSYDVPANVLVGRLRLRMVGTSLDVYPNSISVPRISTTSVAFVNETKHGIGRGPSQLDSQGLDNFRIVPIDT